MDNKAGENYFGHMSQQLRSKGGSAFNAISDRLVLKSSSDLAFGKDAANMLKDKELKSKRQEIDQIEADWSRAQKDIMKSKLSLTALKQTSWHESSPKINFLLCVWKMAKNTNTLHHLHLRLM